MILFDGFAGLVFLALWIFCIVDVITTPAERCRHLPKPLWLMTVILLSDIGSIAWLVAGHTWDGKTGQRTLPIPMPAARNRPGAARPGAARPTNPDDDEEFLASLRTQTDERRRHEPGGGHPGAEDPGTPAS
ncbi:MAG: PLD nuclease N-terminal domain-containing protein [Actinomycetota bacterium]|nr:PLD nuclease N-terminal domain-containing protein [Actinomycetota bacterium]